MRDSVLAKPVRNIDSMDVKLGKCSFTFDVPEDPKAYSEPRAPTVKAPATAEKPVRPLSATRDSPHTDSRDTRFDLAREDTTITKGTPSTAPTETKEKSFPLVKFKLVEDSIKGALDSKDVKYKIDKDKVNENANIKLTGTESSINDAVIMIYEAMNEVKEATVPLDKEIAELVQHDSGAKLQQLLMNQWRHAQVQVQSGTVHVHTIGDPAPVVTAITDFFTTTSIPAKVGSPPLSGSEWDLKKTQLELAKEVVIKEYKGSKGYLQLYGYKQAVEVAKTDIDLFVKGKKLELEIVNLKYENVFRYLRDVKKDAFDSIKQHLP